jgi:hypothetical protein
MHKQCEFFLEDCSGRRDGYMIILEDDIIPGSTDSPTKQNDNIQRDRGVQLPLKAVNCIEY